MSNKKRSKEKIGKLNENQYHKDHFKYDYELNAFNTQKRIFTLLEKYIEPHKDPEKPYKIKRIHNNYEACKNCKA